MSKSVREIKKTMRLEGLTSDLSIALEYVEKLIYAGMDYLDAMHTVTSHFVGVDYDELQQAYDQ